MGNFFPALQPHPVREAFEIDRFAKGGHRQINVSRMQFRFDLLVDGVLNGLADHEMLLSET
jgi:hypothetical protein